MQADRTVEFRVTSADINHGFRLYDASLRALAQNRVGTVFAVVVVVAALVFTIRFLARVPRLAAAP